MALKPLTAIAILAGAAVPASSSPQPSQNPAAAARQSGSRTVASSPQGVRNAIMRIEHYSGGSCATVSIGELAGPILESCHGWHISDCDGVLLARSRGVRLDKAAVIRPVAGDKLASVVQLGHLLQETLNRTNIFNSAFRNRNVVPPVPPCPSVGQPSSSEQQALLFLSRGLFRSQPTGVLQSFSGPPARQRLEGEVNVLSLFLQGYEAFDSYLGHPARLSSSRTNSSGRIVLVTDVDACRQFFGIVDARSRSIRDQLHIAVSGPSGRTWDWLPGSNFYSGS
jgi:hypothetical protein